MIVREYEEDEVTVQKVPLLLMGGMVLAALGLTAAVQLGFFERSAVPEVARAEAGVKPLSQRTLRFFDEPDGTVRVEDGASGAVLSRFGQGEGGFVRASVRSLVYQRKIRREGPAVAFELTEWSNGDLTLSDPVTKQSLELSAFGGVNRAVFAAMLPKPEAR